MWCTTTTNPLGVRVLRLWCDLKCYVMSPVLSLFWNILLKQWQWAAYPWTLFFLSHQWWPFSQAYGCEEKWGKKYRQPEEAATLTLRHLILVPPVASFGRWAKNPHTIWHCRFGSCFLHFTGQVTSTHLRIQHFCTQRSFYHTLLVHPSAVRVNLGVQCLAPLTCRLGGSDPAPLLIIVPSKIKSSKLFHTDDLKLWLSGQHGVSC